MYKYIQDRLQSKRPHGSYPTSLHFCTATDISNSDFLRMRKKKRGGGRVKIQKSTLKLLCHPSQWPPTGKGPVHMEDTDTCANDKEREREKRQGELAKQVT